MTPITVNIDGQDFSGWQSLELRRSIEEMSGQFRLEVTDLEEPYLLGTLRRGAVVEIRIENTLVLAGYVDTVRSYYNSKRSGISVTGRDRVGDLIDCAAVVDGAHDYKDQTLDAVIKEVLKPYKIPLTVSADVGGVFKRLAINPGETAYEFIERICRYRQVLPISDGIGGLHLVKPGEQDSGVSLIYGENILEAEGVQDMRGLHSVYVFKGQSEGDVFSTSEEIATAVGKAYDEKVTRYRPHVVVAESQGYDQTLEERAKWEKNFRRARAVQVSISVQGIHTTSGQVWMPNTLVHVKCPKLQLDRTLLIKTVMITRDKATRTRLEMTLPSSFDLPPHKEPDQADIWGEI